MRIKADNFGTIMTLNGVCYQCLEIQFHSPAEHVDGQLKKPTDLEVQIICKATTVGYIGRKLMLVVLAKFKPDYEEGDNSFFDDMKKWGVPSVSPFERQIMLNTVDLSRLFVPADDPVAALDIDFDYVR